MICSFPELKKEKNDKKFIPLLNYRIFNVDKRINF